MKKKQQVNVDAMGRNFFRQPFRPSLDSFSILSSSELMVKWSDLTKKVFNSETRFGNCSIRVKYSSDQTKKSGLQLGSSHR